MIGEHQRRNAALAKRVTEILFEKFPVNEKKGISTKKCGTCGKVANCSTQADDHFEACHNQEGAETLRQQLQKLPGNKKLTVWFGSLGEERAKEILSVITLFADEITFSTQSAKSMYI